MTTLPFVIEMSIIIGLVMSNQLVWGHLLDPANTRIVVQDEPREWSAFNGLLISLGFPITLPVGLGVLVFKSKDEEELLRKEWRKQKLKRKIEREQNRRISDIELEDE